MENVNEGQSGPPPRRDPVKELQARLEAAIDEVRPKIRKALDEMDARVDEAVAEIRPRAESAMQDVRPKVDQFVADVQPRLDSMLERLQVKINELRKDLDDRATRSSKPVTPAGEITAQGSSAPHATQATTASSSAVHNAGSGHTPPPSPTDPNRDGPGDPGTLP